MLRYILVAVLLGLVTTGCTIVPPPAPLQEESGWKLIFRDEFDGDHLDENRWVRCYWWDNEGCTISSNEELEWYLPENVLVEDGILKLQAREETVTSPEGETYNYTSGMVTTGRAVYERTIDPKFVFQYGYAEIRAKVPKGQGFWPAFWLLPEYHRSKPEIDVLEILGHATNELYMYFHYLDEEGMDQREGDWFVGPDFAEGWHTFAVKWEPNTVIWYVDDVERFRLDDPSIAPATPLYLILNLAVGGEWPGSPDETTPFPSNYEIDYVRVWQQHETTQLLPVQSTYVDEAEPDTNFGDSELLFLDDDPAQLAYLMFDTTALEGQTIDSATLRIWTGGEYGESFSSEQTIHLAEDASWNEAVVAYNDRPEHSTAVLGTLRLAETDEIYDIKLDIDQLQPHIGQVFSLALTSVGGDGPSFYSGKDSEQRVLLTITSKPSDNESTPPSPLLLK